MCIGNLESAKEANKKATQPIFDSEKMTNTLTGLENA